MLGARKKASKVDVSEKWQNRRSRSPRSENVKTGLRGIQNPTLLEWWGEAKKVAPKIAVGHIHVCIEKKAAAIGDRAVVVVEEGRAGKVGRWGTCSRSGFPCPSRTLLTGRALQGDRARDVA